MSNVKVMKGALEVMHYLEALNSDTQQQKVQTITELKEAISEAGEVPAQEVVAICQNCLGTKRPHADDPDWRGRCDCTPPAVQPKQQEWVGLTPDDIRLLEKENTVEGYHGDYCPAWDLIEAVEARLKEKNTNKG
jgi:hypothetical protein